MIRARHTFEQQFIDTAQIGTETGRGFGSNPTANSWAYDSVNTVACKVDDSKSREAKDGTEVSLTDALIYFPSDSTVTGKNRIKITHRYREALGTAQIYAVMGDPKDARCGLVLPCKLVTGESVL